MKHLKAVEQQGASASRRSAPTADERRRRAAAGRPPQQPEPARTFRSAARWCSRRAGKPTAPAARPGCASRSSATCSTATSAATGRRRCPTSSITRPTGPASAPRRRRTGARSISSSRDGRIALMTAMLSRCGPRSSRRSGSRSWPLCGRRCARRRPRSRRQVVAGNGTLIIGTYPDKFWIIDEATEKVVGTIPFKSGIPRRTTLSRDRKRFYTIEAGMEKVEILDIAARTTIDTFTLSEGNKQVRIRSIEPDPLHRFVMLLTASATKLIDRFEIGPPTLVQYDLEGAQDRPHHPVAEQRGAPERPDPVLARRQADVPVQRQDVLIYDTDRLHAGRQVGAVEADRGGLRPARVRLERHPQRRARLLHRHLHRVRSGAAPPDHGHRARQPGGEDGRLLPARARRRR